MRFGNVTLKQKVPCAMRDGVTLYSDIYMPEESGEYPVLLLRQPYGRKIASTVSHAHPVWYASKGYMVIVQDVRGRGDSEGEFVPFVHEAEDGFDTVEWAASLPHSNGRVGMYGFSYQGIVQWAAASLRPPGLIAIVPSMTTGDLHRWVYPFGSFSQGMLIWAYQLARDSARRAGDTGAEAVCSRILNDPQEMLRRMPLNERDPILVEYCPAYFDWVNHSEYDGYWDGLNWLKKFVEAPIPTLHIGGWYDFLLEGTLQSYQALQKLPRTPELFHRLEIGPWVHIPWGRKPGGIDHGPEADGDMHRKQLRWFDYWLKGERDNGVFDEPPVRYFELESMRWREAGRFPDGEGGRRWYMTGSEIPANGALGGGGLTERKAAIDHSAASDVFVYDARLPMPLAGFAPVDRSAQQDRYEILVYSGEPLQESVQVFGAPSVNVTCQSMDGPTDLVAILSLLLPDGRAKFLSVGRIEIGVGGAGDEWRAARIEMRPFAAEFPVGSALRLELTGSAFPTLFRHPNGLPMKEAHRAEDGDLNIAVVAVVSREGMESWIELPVAP
ncbi:CocE/NonD family hydrolase [Cohnella suwonensis]|uniref:CocE/NonD family hydrolase n=1 Tax=Cohnella suwonensis TaxID=696072 RepID=A0ABW0LRW7_9BACL